MAARGVGRQTGARGGARTRGNAGRLAEGGRARVVRTVDDPRARDARTGLRRIIDGIGEGGRPRPALLLGGTFALGLVVLAVRFFMGSRPARQPDATPAPAAAPLRAEAGGATEGERAPASPVAARQPDAANAPVLTSGAGADGAMVASDTSPVTPACDEAAPVRVTGIDGHVPPVVVSVQPPPSTPWPQTPTTPTGGPTP
jgi:hypothetical protein